MESRPTPIAQERTIFVLAVWFVPHMTVYAMVIAIRGIYPNIRSRTKCSRVLYSVSTVGGAIVSAACGDHEVIRRSPQCKPGRKHMCARRKNCVLKNKIIPPLTATE